MLKNSIFEDYKKAPLTDAERKQLEQEGISESASFKSLPGFGTGGMRATVKNGANHLNRYVIARLNLALGEIIAREFPGGKVVIGYDSRNSSVEFSRISYHILKKAGLDVKVYRRVIPTPMVSYGVRYLKAQAGIVITASHNPPEYNGFKVYWNDGAQIIPPFDASIEKRFKELSFGDVPANIAEMALLEVPNDDLIEEEVINAYIAELKEEKFVTSAPKKKRILYSPLHGTGGWIFERVFSELKFENFSILASQKEPDGNFPDTKSANPEEKEAFEGLIQEGLKDRIPLLIATDPDADRVGVAVLTDNGYQFLTGNQIGSLLLEKIGKARKGEKGYICKTIVTTELQRKIAEDYGFETVEVLTGFKYIAEVVGKDPQGYIFGGEESYGYLPVSWVRDKDAVSAAVAIAELAEKEDLLTILDRLHLKYGIYTELLHNIHLKPGGVSMQEVMAKLDDPKGLLGEQIGSRKVADILDLRKNGKQPGTAMLKEFKQKLPSADVVQFYLEPEGRLTLRPSGTEPKIKAYLSIRNEAPGTASELDAARKAALGEANAILKEFLDKLGV